ncbi:MAG: gliding motility protein GldC [Cryomorphaceae bacterium]
MKDKIAKQTTIHLDIGLDENNVPIEMKWDASDGGGSGLCKALMLSMWDEKEENTMRIDLWNKEMSVYDMQRFVHQSILTMGDTYERATGQKEGAAELRAFAKKFAEKAGIIS